MQLYTKTGDHGMTKLIGGGMVGKDSDRVSAYGSIDELNTWVGLCIVELENNFDDLSKELQQLQQFLFDLGSDLANPELNSENSRLDKRTVQWIEQKIDQYQDVPPAITRFILPGGSKESALLQVCRTITRRAERHIVTLNWTSNLPESLLIFVNRLSDYFYALARVANFRNNVSDVYYENGNEVFKK
ncbi:cob(I)yrinic acid a,c-diamide adenosyltransferase [Loigolactobacillus coryniformis]|jgi:cob(I)alamin adenosyltransferase|uniref:Corrinoid adenosyltransferase n=2 Tax=Loigolactobacillus coryniformis TaxID=1610 RepID=J3JAY8_9LACO|nr:cob(I)yrinic acid a,c-diamide adenosyltransferase [Loigolactobacillus coryniformis]EJN55267.1 ATP:cob(I)alamin adenosyltransferase [Loigolactobacillus coryniformis subsp. coryniformis CECT 5711]MBW4803214.1 cob(I)yrinic acid a,c-diamide adenosyltransferase [Loigolactobacillus coryniformis subsp. torquens]MBW4805909.1 cob(I)yrinic acid a,c-diamide adenosyltransferase [Loigolactobacillus coryniformis subsp. torquens]MDC4184951.1 cob(I)yrinic acid a,c-diamide adenosyltransferase [Loigolactobaci